MQIETVEAAVLPDTDRVEMTIRSTEPGQFRAATAHGTCEFRRTLSGYEVTEVSGSDPLANQATDALVGFHTEQTNTIPTARDNAYPYAFERIAQIFDHASAPDLMIIRSAAFHVHGNLGEHGSLASVQSRAAFLAGGVGIKPQGVIDRHLMAVDVAPTMAAVLGCAADEHGRHLSAQDGEADMRLLNGERADHVIAFLFDGLSANLLCDALDAGDVPNIASVAANGTCYREGSIASLPTVTLPNHTTLLTGAHPGHHGILSNEWFNRATGSSPNLLDWDQMIHACDHLAPGVETLFEAVRRTHQDAFTVATYEYADRGADWSTYGELRAQRTPQGVPRKTATVPGATSEWFEPNPGYHFMSRIDSASTAQACALLDPAAENPPPTFMWVNYSLTDEAGHHGGPHSAELRDALRDTDRRMGDVLDAADRLGLLDSTAVFVLADHGMELTDPNVQGHYRPSLDAAGMSYRDLDDGLLYLS